MSLCKGQVRPDMYGLGIRISSYVQWFAAIVFQRTGPESLPEIRLLGLLLSGGVAIGLLHQISQGKLDAAAIYVLLLLATGPHTFLVPVYIWRALTCCDPFWNPLEGYGEEQLRVFRVLNFALIITASSIGVWFYTTHLPALNRGCVQYGFFFGKTSLDDNAPFAALNALLYLLMVLTERFERMRAPHTLVNLVVFAVLVVAVELPVQWNELWGSNQIDTSAQVIPLLVSVGIVVRVTYLHFVEDGDEERSTVVPLAAVPEGNGWALEMPRQVPAAYAGRGARRMG
ncbi:hypothetical protein HRG_000038 [Hirsutella rhossiliensis]|uniref:Uncharacterized protein n=1 Tax=Hirsutella rhossiliensis TaxID=111463 RepID=A0A9P8SLX5_9HYPO|nr:uncharacterized protein HRG_00038 [Hirsutella rhossiliensis]KAH0967396.1 hypothetical protein HRG_00038 [Hirsutella rhossiliensis]